MRDIPLTLIPFAPEPFANTIKNSLTAQGFTVRTLQTQNPVLSGALHRPRGVAVLLVGCSAFPGSKFLSLLRDLQDIPRFGIFESEQTHLTNDIVDSFSDFSTWPCPDRELVLRLERLWKKCPRTSQTERKNSALDDLKDLNLIGRSPEFMNAIRRIRKFTCCDAPVLVEGETGTGKELAARAIHYLSARRGYPFIPVNCGAMPDNLIENELFGHDKGAYTDASRSHMGLIAQAEGGTLFLDEVEALSPKAQITLLRFLQEGEYRALGATRVVKANIRVVGATNAPIQQLVERGQFRRDLLYRLNIMPVILPPLRKRGTDIELLAEHFMSSHRIEYNQPNKYLHPSTLHWMNEYAWPGNVRELENLLHREFLLADGDAIWIGESDNASLEIVKEALVSGVEENQPLAFSAAKAYAIETFEKSYLSELMCESNGNVTRAAKRAGKERRALGKLLKKYGIDKRDYL